MPSGRLPINVEFLRKLRPLSGHLTVKAFAAACGKPKQVANFSNYLSGASKPGDKLLGECIHALFGWQVVVVQEIAPLPKPLSSVTTDPGIYALYDHNMSLIYVGQAQNLYSELGQTLNRKVPGLAGYKIKDRARYCSLYIIRNAHVRHNVEALLIRVVGHQTYNTDVESFKP